MTDTLITSFIDENGNVREFPKKRGRPVMDEVFFYDPYEHWIIIDPEKGTFVMGDMIAWDNETLTVKGTIVK